MQATPWKRKPPTPEATDRMPAFFDDRKKAIHRAHRLPSPDGPPPSEDPIPEEAPHREPSPQQDEPIPPKDPYSGDQPP
jgi:hypothetical protein